MVARHAADHARRRIDRRIIWDGVAWPDLLTSAYRATRTTRSTTTSTGLRGRDPAQRVPPGALAPDRRHDRHSALRRDHGPLADGPTRQPRRRHRR
jgi:hypothetical protein